MLTCVKVALNSPGLRKPDFNILELSDWNFTSPRGVSAFMQFSFLKHLLGFAGARELTSLAVAINSKMLGDEVDRVCKVFPLQYEILQNRS